MRTALWWLLFLILVAAGYLYGREYVRRHPQDFPWTELRLGDPVGLFTVRKLAALGDQPAQCRALLAQAGVGDLPAPPKSSGADCGYADGMRLGDEGRTVAFVPAGLVTSCPVAATLVLFERDVLQPAARRHFGRRAAIIDHSGSYSCRRLYGRLEGEFSEHATADALDIIGFRLTDGTQVSVVRDWRSSGPEGRFLREVRDGSCRLFATVLSPDYNAAHADHLHLDQAERGRIGGGLCR
ncbi:extensin family protein [Sphingomonas sp.]|uniref:extensin-like domain-containing protein n=1 Tax=Sphingomonas sp. TaxID=28214 RepID=UPI001808BA63|nr:extensin family protein [Sphingomonas sp.]MBA3511436.1 extensin family protein [Sphingomonas sp.]